MKHTSRAIAVLFLMAAVTLAAGCGSSGDPSMPDCALSGTITDVFRTVSPGDTITVAIGNAPSAIGPYVQTQQITWPAGSTASYVLDIGSLAPGDYYVLALTGDTAHWGHSGLVPIDCGSTINVSIINNMN